MWENSNIFTGKVRAVDDAVTNAAGLAALAQLIHTA